MVSECGDGVSDSAGDGGGGCHSIGNITLCAGSDKRWGALSKALSAV